MTELLIIGNKKFEVFFSLETGNFVFLSIKGYAGHLQKC